MQYFRLRFDFPDVGQRSIVVDRLQRLYAQLDAEIPEKDQEEHLLLATWNIRDIGKDYLKYAGTPDKKKMRRGKGPRMKETYYYIAEIISRFDFVAVQEVNDIEEWEIVMGILGRDWDYIATDVTDSRLGGNGERLTYVYDRRKVFFRKIAGELVLPNELLISKVATSDKKLYAGKQFSRTPFLASFQSSWFQFDICTVHIYYGEDSGPKLAQRIEEIERVAAYLSEVADSAIAKRKALIILGDFNIVSPEHETMAALKKHGFLFPGTEFFKTNVSGTKYYDQIAFKAKGGILGVKPTDTAGDAFGTFEFFKSVFRAEDAEAYKASMLAIGIKETNLPKSFLDWRTYQMSDHKPLWVRIAVNDSANYLNSLKA